MKSFYRIAETKDRERIIDFINYVFSQKHTPHDFKTLLPKEYGDGRRPKAVHFLAEDERGIRGVTAVLPFTLLYPGGCLSGGFVGSVSVHPYSRGEGHMRRLMAMTNRYMEENGMDLAVLSGARQRYEYYGYSRGGLEYTAEFNRDNFRHRAADIPGFPIRFRKLEAESAESLTSGGADTCFDCPAAGMGEGFTGKDAGKMPVTPQMRERKILNEVYALYRAQPVRIDRDPAEFADICGSWNQSLYAILNEEETVGYLAASPRSDIRELVLKPGIPSSAVLKCWQEFSGADHFTADIALSDRELLKTAGWLSEACTLSEGHNIRVINWGRTLQALLSVQHFLKGSLPEGECAFLAEGQPVHIVSCFQESAKQLFSFDNHVPESAPDFSRIDLQNRLFGVGGLVLPESIGGAPEGWFPLYYHIPSSDCF